MQKLTVTFDGVEGKIEQTHYFNLSETDLAEIIAKDPDFFKASRLKLLLDRAKTASQEDKLIVQAEMVKFVKEVLLHAHGTRIGAEFKHIPEDTLSFSQGLACDAALRYVVSTEETIINFFRGVLPESMRNSFTLDSQG